jgi:predicted ATPase
MHRLVSGACARVSRMIVERIHVPSALITEPRAWPWSVPAVGDLIDGGVVLSAPVTFLVGENGSGKSTIIEAIAEAWGVDVRGGQSGRKYSSELPKSQLGEAMRLDRGLDGSAMVKTRAKGFFLRSETALDVFQRLGYGASYTAVSHGESYLQAFDDWFSVKGLYLLDEPEAALSFTACLSLIAAMDRVVKAGGQVICATHSPLLASMPGADILELTGDGLGRTLWSDLELVQHWRRYLDDPARYLRHVLD